MSLTAFNRQRRIKLVEAMKPENIIAEEVENPEVVSVAEVTEVTNKPLEDIQPEVVEQINEEVETTSEQSTTRGRRRRTSDAE